MTIDIKNARKVKIENAKTAGIDIKNVESIEMKNIHQMKNENTNNLEWLKALLEEYSEEMNDEWYDNTEVMEGLAGAGYFVEWVEEKLQTSEKN